MLNKNIQRPHFYNGRRLSSQEFQDNQNYHILMRMVQNSFYHTRGILSGLEVIIKGHDDVFEVDFPATERPAITIKKGFGFVKLTRDDIERISPSLLDFSDGSQGTLLHEVVLTEDITLYLDTLAVYHTLARQESLELSIIIEFDFNKTQDMPYKGPELIQTVENPRIRILDLKSETPEADYIILGELGIEQLDASRYPLQVKVILNTTGSTSHYPMIPDERAHKDRLSAWFDPVAGLQGNIFIEWTNNIQPAVFNLVSDNSKLNKLEEITQEHIKLITTRLLSKQDTDEPFLVKEFYLRCKIETDGGFEIFYNLLTLSCKSGTTGLDEKMILGCKGNGTLRVFKEDDPQNDVLSTIYINGNPKYVAPLDEWFTMHVALRDEIEINDLAIKDGNREWSLSLAEFYVYKNSRDKIAWFNSLEGLEGTIAMTWANNVSVPNFTLISRKAEINKIEEISQEYIKLTTTRLFRDPGQSESCTVQEIFMLCKIETGGGFNEYNLFTFTTTANSPGKGKQIILRRNIDGDLIIFREGDNNTYNDEIYINGVKDARIPLAEWFILYVCLQNSIEIDDLAINDGNSEWTFYLSEFFIYDHALTQAMDNFSQYLKNKYDETFFLATLIRPLVVYQARGGECEKLVLDKEAPAVNAHMAVGNGNNPDDKTLYIRAHKIYISGEKYLEYVPDAPAEEREKKTRTTIDKNVRVSGDVLVKGNFTIAYSIPVAGAESTDSATFLLTKELIVKDNILTLNYYKQEDNSIPPGEGGFEIYIGKTSEDPEAEDLPKPYIKWDDVNQRWIAFDGIKQGEIAADLPSELGDESLADAHHHHTFIAPENNRNYRIMGITENSRVYIPGAEGDLLPEGLRLAEDDMLLVDGDVEADAVILPPADVGTPIGFLFPEGLTITHADQTMDLNEDLYTHLFDPKAYDLNADPGAHVKALRALIASNRSILIGDGELVLNESIVIGASVQNLTIKGGGLTKLILPAETTNMNSAFVIGGNQCSRITIGNFIVSGDRDFLQLGGPVNGLRVENCEYREGGDSSLIAAQILGGFLEIRRLEVVDNSWETTGVALNLINVEIINSVISDNYFRYAVTGSSDRGSLFDLSEIKISNLKIHGNRFCGRNGNLNFLLAPGSGNLDFSRNTIDMQVTWQSLSRSWSVILFSRYGNNVADGIEGVKIRSNTITLQPTFDGISLIALQIKSIQWLLITDNIVALSGRYCTGLWMADIQHRIVSNNIVEGMINTEEDYTENIYHIKPIEFYVKIQRIVNDVVYPFSDVVEVYNNGKQILEHPFGIGDNAQYKLPEQIAITTAEKDYNYHFKVFEEDYNLVDAIKQEPVEDLVYSREDLIALNSPESCVVLTLKAQTFDLKINPLLERDDELGSYSPGTVNLTVKTDTGIVIFSGVFPPPENRILHLPRVFEAFSFEVSEEHYVSVYESEVETNQLIPSGSIIKEKDFRLDFERFSFFLKARALNPETNNVEDTTAGYEIDVVVTHDSNVETTIAGLVSGDLVTGSNSLNLPRHYTGYLMRLQKVDYKELQIGPFTSAELAEYTENTPLEGTLEIKEFTLRFNFTFRDRDTYEQVNIPDENLVVEVMGNNSGNSTILLPSQEISNGATFQFIAGFESYTIRADKETYATLTEIKDRDFFNCDDSVINVMGLAMEFPVMATQLNFEITPPEGSDFILSGSHLFSVENSLGATLLSVPVLPVENTLVNPDELTEIIIRELPEVYDEFFFRLYTPDNILRWQSGAINKEVPENSITEPLTISLTAAPITFYIDVELSGGGEIQDNPVLIIDGNALPIVIGLNKISLDTPIQAHYDMEIVSSIIENETLAFDFHLLWQYTADSACPVPLNRATFSLGIKVRGWDVESGLEAVIPATVELFDAQTDELLWSGNTNDDNTNVQSGVSILKAYYNKDIDYYIVRVKKEGYTEYSSNAIFQIRLFRSSNNPFEVNLIIQFILAFKIHVQDSKITTPAEAMVEITVDNQDFFSGVIADGTTIPIEWRYNSYQVSVSKEGYQSIMYSLGRDAVNPANSPVLLDSVLRIPFTAYINLELNPPETAAYLYSGPAGLVVLDNQGALITDIFVEINGNKASNIVLPLLQYIGPYTINIMLEGVERWQSEAVTMDFLLGSSVATPVDILFFAAAFTFDLNVGVEADTTVPDDFMLTIHASNGDEQVFTPGPGIVTINLPLSGAAGISATYTITLTGSGFFSKTLTDIPFDELWNYQNTGTATSLSLILEPDSFYFYIRIVGMNAETGSVEDIDASLKILNPAVTGEDSALVTGPLALPPGINQVGVPLAEGISINYILEISREGYAMHESGTLERDELVSYNNQGSTPVFEIRLILQTRVQLNILARDPDTGDLVTTYAMITLTGYRESDTFILHQNLQVEDGEVLVFPLEYDRFEFMVSKFEDDNGPLLSPYASIRRRFLRDELKPASEVHLLIFELEPVFSTLLRFHLNIPEDSDYVLSGSTSRIEAVDISDVIYYVEDVTGISLFTFERDVNLPDKDASFIFRFFSGEKLRWESELVGKSDLVISSEPREPVDIELTLKPFKFYFNLVGDTEATPDSLETFEIVFTGSGGEPPATFTRNLHWGLNELESDELVEHEYTFVVKATGYQDFHSSSSLAFYQLWNYDADHALTIQMNILI